MFLPKVFFINQKILEGEKYMSNNSIAIYMVSLTVVLIISFIVIYIYSKYLNYKLYECYKEEFEELKTYHKKRYQLYFCGEKSEIDNYTQLIEESAQVILKVGEKIIKQKYFNKRQKEEIKQIMEQTKGLLKTQKS